MVGHFVRLKWRLLANLFRRGPAIAVGLAIGLLWGVGAAIQVAFLLGAVGSTDAFGTAAVTATSLLWVGWTVFPILLAAQDNLLDPRKFSLLPISPTELLTGMLVSSLLGAGAVWSSMAMVGLVVGGARAAGLVGGVAALVGAVMAVVTAVVTSRALTAALSDVLRGRRGREAAALLTLLPVAGVVLVSVVLPDQGPGVATDGSVDLVAFAAGLLAPVVAVAAWTPGGAAGGFVESVVAGRPGRALGQLAVVIAWTTAMLALWRTRLARLHDDPPGRRAGRDRATPLEPLPLRLLPSSPTTAVAARTLRQLVRDNRWRQQSIGVVALPVPIVIFAAHGLWDGPHGPLLALAVLAVVAVLALNQLGLDGPALWLHQVVGNDPAVDFRGRNLALGGVAALLAVTIGIALATVTGAWGALPVLVVALPGLCLAILGVGNAASALAPLPLPEADAGAFGQTNPGAGVLDAIKSMVAFGLVVVLAAPQVAALILLHDRPLVRMLAMLAGAVWGWGVWRVGTGIGAAHVRHRYPELVAAVTPE